MQKNFAVFIVVCIAIIMGWLWVQQQIWPPRPRDPNQIAKNDGAKDKKDADKKKVEKKDDDKKGDEKKEVKPPKVQPEQKPEIKAKPEVKSEPVPQTVLLGGDNTHLQVLLTTHGAGVQKLTLNRFKAADYLGRPVKRNLDLIPEDSFMPSFLMYHFADAGADHPVLGLGAKTWQLDGQDKRPDGTEEVRFSVRVLGSEHIKITKTYRLAPKDYHLTLLLEIERDKQGGDAKEHKFRYQLTGAHGLPIEGESYTSTFRKAIIGMLNDNGTLIRELDNEDSYRISHRGGGDRVPRGNRMNQKLQYACVATQYFASGIVIDDLQPDKEVDPKSILAWARPTLETTETRGTIKGIVGDTLWLKEAVGLPKPFQLLPHVKLHIEESKLKDGDQVMLSFYETPPPDGKSVATWIRRGQSPRPFLDDITVRVNSEEILLRAGDKVAHQFLLYHGPVKTRLLGQFSGEESVDDNLVDRYTDKLHLSTLTDYQSQWPFGTFAKFIGFTWLLIQTTKLMHGLLYVLNLVVFGYHGLSIILLTVLVRGLMFPISKKQALFSIKMQAVGPELKKIQEKYKNDPQGKSQATMELYRKHKVHPLGGCLPMFLQLPIFLGLYYALQESISFRLAGFLWIENLAAPDMLIWWSESIPFISDPDSQGGFFYLGPFFNLLPIFAVGLMFIQQKLMTPPATDEQQAMTQKTMQFMMIFMGIVFYKVASGLCIYFTASSLWGLAERKLLPKKKTGEVVVAAPPPNGKASSARGKAKAPVKPDGNGTVQKVKDWWAKLLEDARKK